MLTAVHRLRMLITLKEISILLLVITLLRIRLQRMQINMYLMDIVQIL
nr:MAG TPA: hypothetical protein [Caudoviricetes sp.]